jgi:hypothetical protein
MEKDPSWGAASHSATQNFPKILWELKVHYRFHKNLPLVPNLRQINRVHTTASSLSKINFSITFPSTSMSSYWSLPLLPFYHYFLCNPPPIDTCYISYQSHTTWLNFRKYIWWRVQDFKHLIMQFFPVSYNSVPLGYKYQAGLLWMKLCTCFLPYVLSIYCTSL